ncbi:Uncharacterised protein [Clostridioides difficile]|uniref:Uncharacterized protein n=5 Tax=Clostridioides difficile TaxID=1496 RepID=A0A9R0BNC0_CLODR|nr:hypothetical protein [Clostridioides difficile]OFU03718.1 hypothetical protein HMPREF3085_05255 [Clostridium sp. HMSC19E03]OFU11596.1 hypothetical protein HMPREF3079_18160 [Clostridium sp. HMSC19C09]OFU17660.1 hypothetical protein HMPREF3078_11250 [Clostridium sp. HMSC19C08]OFU20084.1 hypothetical protein HMPREF3077_11800 [Clostridium sp. HMSC19C05]OFU31666.1 hypothetical protein HMPREF3074_09890 [Clostridium sp. HMSC19B10]OFU45288.1 hypothetical protein HMPREF3072_03985 [Clostridium sp. H
MKISSQYRSQYSFRHESNINNTRINESMVKKNETVGKDTYLSNIMKQKQELNDRIRDLKYRQEVYTKKINEAIKNLYKSEIRETTNNFSNIEIGIKNSIIEDKNKSTMLDENSTYLNTNDEKESLITKESNEKIEEEILNDEKLEELEQKKDYKEDSNKKEKVSEDLSLVGKTREELENMLKNFINLTQEEIMKLESRIEKLDKDAEEYKQNSKTNIFDKTDEQKKHINVLI